MVCGGLFVNHTKQLGSLSLSLSYSPSPINPGVSLWSKKGQEMQTELSAYRCVSILGRFVLTVCVCVCAWLSRAVADFLPGLVVHCRTMKRPPAHRCVCPHVLRLSSLCSLLGSFHTCRFSSSSVS